MNGEERVLIHPRCRSCETTYPRVVRTDETCSSCGQVDWIEKHQPAFELIHRRADGWHGVQDYENVHAGDELELLIDGEWRRATVDHLEALGFFARGWGPGVELEYRGFETEHVLWRWPGRRPQDKGWVGRFASREAAETVLHDWAPGYLVCGVCGWDGWKTEIAEHYRRHHRGGSDTVAMEHSQRRPIRRLA